MPPSCLIGSTGFVGGNLRARHRFDAEYHAATIDAARGRAFDLVVCAAPQARKWWANQHPEADRAMVDALLDALAAIQAARFVLVSTVDVFPQLTGVDETFDCEAHANHAYGRHRLALEAFVARRFPVHHIVRLPGLFGPGLRKNLIYDLIHDHELEKIHPGSVLQWYDVGRLWRDLQAVVAHDLRLVTFATEPLPTEEIRGRFFPGSRIGPGAGLPSMYDVRSVHAASLGGSNGYLLDRHEVLASLAAFVERERSIRA